jgi:hypothetical protein
VPLNGRNRCRRVERRQLPDFVRRPGERVSEPEREKGPRSGSDPIELIPVKVTAGLAKAGARLRLYCDVR